MSSMLPDDPKNAHLVPSGSVEEGYLLLPYSKDEFKEFISSLLGTPQAIKREFVGGFVVGTDDVRNIHQLISQRIQQQNDATLAKFDAQIVFNDGSSVELNSLGDLLVYNEVRPVVSRALHVRWDWLVKFQDKQVPEKQSIQLSFAGFSTTRKRLISADDAPEMLVRRGGAISLRIEYTARTWGVDMDALLSNHILGIIKHEPPFKRFFHTHHGRISLGSGALFLITSWVGAVVATRSISHARLRELQQILPSSQATDLTQVREAITFIATFVAGGAWSQYFFALMIVLLGSLVLALILAVWIDSSLDLREPGFVLLTKESHKDKERLEAALNKRWRSFWIALSFGVLVEIVGSLVFRSMFG
jgi:hypothetical protein